MSLFVSNDVKIITNMYTVLTNLTTKHEQIATSVQSGLFCRMKTGVDSQNICQNTVKKNPIWSVPRLVVSERSSHSKISNKQFKQCRTMRSYTPRQTTSCELNICWDGLVSCKVKHGKRPKNWCLEYWTWLYVVQMDHIQLCFIMILHLLSAIGTHTSISSARNFLTRTNETQVAMIHTHSSIPSNCKRSLIVLYLKIDL